MDKKKKKVPGLPTRTRESVKDERFAQVLKNPVYRPVPRQEKKVDIDRRFQGMFNDERFKLKYKVDKRGRPIATATDENLKRYYNLEEEEADKDGAGNGRLEKDDEDESEGSSESDEEDSDVEGDVKEESMISGGKLKIDKRTREKLHSKEVDYARGEADLEDESSSDEDDSSSADESEVDLPEHDWGELDKDADRTEESTRRLALCNMDWDRVRAVDLMVLLSSFLPPGGMIKQVAIYPSEFGKERMAEEEKEGPRELRGEPTVKKEATTSDEEESESEKDEDNEDETEGGQYQREKLRQYQLNRLKYYYAVAEFDSAATAEKVYSECDGMEYESSAAKVDLRFVPDDMSFDEDTPKEICQEMPDREKYRPRFFTTTALQQVKVDLTWDETDPLRKELTEKIFDPKEKVDDDDIRAYLATSSEEEEEDEEDEPEEVVPKPEENTKSKKKQDAISKYKALLEGIDQEKKKKEKDVAMEITWGVGLKENTEKLVKKKMEEEEKKKRTPWEEMLDKRKEKRQQRKKEKNKSKKGEDSDDEDADSDEEQPFSDDDVDVDMDDEFFKSEMRQNDILREGLKKKKSKPKNERLEVDGDKDKKKDAELELLLMDEDDTKKHFSLKKIMEEENDSKAKKKRKSKLKKKKMEKPEDTRPDDFQIDVEDQRFSALFSSHHFNVDPSDPNFKKTKAMERIIQEKWRRRNAPDQPKDNEASAVNGTGSTKRKFEEVAGENNKNESQSKKAELSFLVKSIKRNTENLKKSQNVKKMGKAKFK